MLKQTFRRLVRSPGFSATTILTLALGLGATSAIFALIDGTLLKPLNYPESDRLVGLWHTAPGLKLPQFEQSEGTYLTYTELCNSFQGIAAFNLDIFNLTGRGEPEQLKGELVSPNFFGVLRTSPALGREFTEQDAQEGAPPVVILTHGFWSRLYGRSPAVLGQFIELDGVRREIVGVMPPGFQFPEVEPGIELYVPLRINASKPRVTSFQFDAVARLKDGVNLETVDADLNQALARLPEIYGDEFPRGLFEQAQMKAFAHFLKDDVVGDVGNVLWLLLGTVGLLLLIVCGNVANLLAVRAEGRVREVALRSALGARPSQLLSISLTESLILSAIGGILGLALAQVGIELLQATGWQDFPRLAELAVDARVALFALAVSLFTGLGLGALPGVRHALPNIIDSLKEGGRTSTSGRHQHRVRNSLVTVQVALALVLLVGSGLMLRTTWRLQSVDPGFRTDGVLTMRIPLPSSDYNGPDEAARFFQQVVERVRAVPGVIRAGASSYAPLESNGERSGLWFEDFSTTEETLPYVPYYRVVTEGYFETLSIPLLAGRTLERADHEHHTGAVVVSEALAKKFWPDQSPLGRRVKRDRDTDDWYTIVGVVGSVRNEGLQGPLDETIYFGMSGVDPEDVYIQKTMSLVVQSPLPASGVLPSIKDAVWQVDPKVPIAEVRTIQEVLGRSMGQTTFTMLMLVIAAVAALFLGSVGIYGVVSYATSQRTQEIGIRMALGAGISQIKGMVVFQGLRMVAVGAVVGIVGAFALTRVMTAMLYETSPTDLPTLLGTVTILGMVSAVATYLPARRAARLDPARAVRAE